MSAWTATPCLLACLLAGAGGLAAQGTAASGKTATGAAELVRVVIRADAPMRVFDPRKVWGAALDGHDLSETTTIYSDTNIRAMRSAGFGPITYRLRTELGIETWHWNPAGRWSDSAHRQGYWISDTTAAQPITLSFGYRLPRRGRTIDDANNDGYSRIDDGDTTTFWKSNPYLDPRLTHDDDRQHPQWLSVDLGSVVALDEIRLLWGDPYPRYYTVEYWTGDQTQLIDDNPAGRWLPFAEPVSWSHGGLIVTRRSQPVESRFIRVVMRASSHTAAGGNGDRRDSLGFALREVYAGTDSSGWFRDEVHHAASSDSQSVILVSSTDSWHREIDRDTSVAQPGLDLVLRSALVRNQPSLIPTGLLFDTPENAAAELRYLNKKKYPLLGIELGEEPDGQRITPEDYGALYLQFASALRQVDRRAWLGGPSWQNLLDDPLTLWPTRENPGARSSWIGRFLDYVDAHRRSADFGFLSFEWYPFDNVCDDPRANLAASHGMLIHELARLSAAGLPDTVPLIMTEYGYSAHISTAEVTQPAAVFDADLIGNFFSHRGARSFFFGYEPGYLAHEPGCPHWGNLVMFLADSGGTARDRTPRYYAAWMLTHAWADSAGGSHTMFPVAVTQDSMVSAYALRRPDGHWSVLLVNRDGDASRQVVLQLARSEGTRAFTASQLWQYSDAQYRFEERGENGRPVIDLPPEHRRLRGGEPLVLPPWSVTVVTDR